MVRFVTLYLGLVVGGHPVEVMVDDRVAAVELRLDGEAAARIDGPPWIADLDFGEVLAPQQLVAVAYDARGEELARAEQTINEPRPRAEAELLLERDADDRPVAARVAWQSTEEERPADIRVTLDGERLLRLDPHRFALPELDGDGFHVVQAEVRFESGDRALAEVTFGGEYLAETGDRLTAALISLTGRKRRFELDELNGWFLVEGRPQPVVALEEGPAEVLFVRAGDVAAEVTRLTTSKTEYVSTGGTHSGSSPTSAVKRIRTALPLPAGFRVRLLEPFATKTDRGHLSFESFIASPDLSEQGGVPWALTQRFALSSTFTQPRVADAVAVAGLQAAFGNHRRVVVLVTTAGQRDFSTIRPAAAIAYLERLQVPLLVWHLGTGSAGDGWPDATVIDDYRDLSKAVRSLEKSLARQRVIWLDGIDDPASIHLTPEAPARLAGVTRP